MTSRRAVADAFEVEPAFLDPPFEEPVDEVEEYEHVASISPEKGFWMDLLAYLDPTNLSNKIRTPLLITLWLGMMITGALSALTTGILMLLNFLNPSNSYTQI